MMSSDGAPRVKGMSAMPPAYERSATGIPRASRRTGEQVLVVDEGQRVRDTPRRLAADQLRAVRLGDGRQLAKECDARGGEEGHPSEVEVDLPRSRARDLVQCMVEVADGGVVDLAGEHHVDA